MDKNVFDLLPPDSFKKLDDKTQEELLNDQTEQFRQKTKKYSYFYIFCIILTIISLIYTPFIINHWWNELSDSSITLVKIYIGRKLEFPFWVLINIFIIYSAHLLFTGEGYKKFSGDSVNDPVDLKGTGAQIYGFILFIFGLSAYYFLFIGRYTDPILKWLRVL